MKKREGQRKDVQNVSNRENIGRNEGERRGTLIKKEEISSSEGRTVAQPLCSGIICDLMGLWVPREVGNCMK